MTREFEVRWEGDLPARPDEVWDAITARTGGWLWEIEYEPRVGGAERGLSSRGGSVLVWEPPARFTTRAGVNQLDYALEPRGTGTYMRYRHRGAFEEDYDVQLDACRRHTAFYYHSLGEYLRHFRGRDAVYVAAQAPASSADGGFAALKRVLGLPDALAAGDRVRLAPGDLEPIDGVADYVTDAFLGVRSADALYRFYGRDAWGFPVGAAHHLFGDGAGSEQAWSDWLNEIFASRAVA
jgi:hypothetical protein